MPASNQPPQTAATAPTPITRHPQAKRLHSPDPVSQPLARAHMRPRHWGLLTSFTLVVLLPALISVAYLYLWAANQYHSQIAFSIRSEDSANATAGLLGTLTQMGTGSAADVDILFEYIQSPQIVEEIDAQLDLRALYNRAESDPVFTLGGDKSIEELVEHWWRMVDVDLDGLAGIVHVQTYAFSPQDAHAIASAILERSDALVNELAQKARDDAVRFAREELAETEVHLRRLRQELTTFRRDHNIVDPKADLASQSGLLGALQKELAQALVDRDVLLSYAAPGDQRVQQAERRIEAIGARIEGERGRMSAETPSGSLSEVLGAYEELRLDLEFANTAYTQALANLGVARSEARRQSRYLAAHIRPTLAQSPLYPSRLLLSALVALFLLLGWGTLMLIYYNIRDTG